MFLTSHSYHHDNLSEAETCNGDDGINVYNRVMVQSDKKRKLLTILQTNMDIYGGISVSVQERVVVLNTFKPALVL